MDSVKSVETSDKTIKKLKTPKSVVKKKKIKRKRRTETYSTYIYKILKQVHPQIGISRRSMLIINSSINDIFQQIACEAGTLFFF